MTLHIAFYLDSISAVFMRLFRHFSLNKRMNTALITFIVGLFPAVVLAQMQDGAGHRITLATPAQRIVTLAPHATELTFFAGAQNKLVGVAQYSDFPAQAANLPKVAAAGTVDIERIIALKPDLVVSWASGVPPAAHAQLRALGIAVFESEPRTLAAIADEIDALAQLTGTAAAAKEHSTALRTRLARLQQAATAAQSSGRGAPVQVFHQIWERPLMTINGQHIMSDAIRICGGQNIFSPLTALTATVSTEAVIARNPQLISTGVAAQEKPGDPLAQWRTMPGLRAAQNKAFLLLDANKFSRATPRMLDEVEKLCAAIAKLAAQQ
jgi:iron complex transport system substrate-binding protein